MVIVMLLYRLFVSTVFTKMGWKYVISMRVHYTQLHSIENMREAYTAVRRGVFNLDIILENSVTYKLDEIADVFASEAKHWTPKIH